MTALEFNVEFPSSAADFLPLFVILFVHLHLSLCFIPETRKKNQRRGNEMCWSFKAGLYLKDVLIDDGVSYIWNHIHQKCPELSAMQGPELSASFIVSRKMDFFFPPQTVKQ